MSIRVRLTVLAAGLALLAVAGCKETLETGYVPRQLDATDEQVKAYYADPFTPGARRTTEGESGTPRQLPQPPKD